MFDLLGLFVGIAILALCIACAMVWIAKRLRSLEDEEVEW